MLDEADQMLDLGFIHAIRKIAGMLPKQRQNLFFSATMPKEIAGLAATLLTDPVRVEVAPVATTAERVNQARHPCRPRQQGDAPGRAPEGQQHDAHAGVHPHQARRRQGRAASLHRAASPPPPSTATRARPSASARWPASRPARSSCSWRPTSRRAASTSTRVSHVINYDLPHVPESYVHRIGRTARAGPTARPSPSARRKTAACCATSKRPSASRFR